MAKKAKIVCLKCGRGITEPVRFCPYCAAPLPGTEPETEEEEKQEQDPNIGYWNFYGAVPESEEELTAGPMGARGWLRFAAAVILIGCLVAGLAGNGWSWTFNWSSAKLIWIIGAGVAVVLFALSFVFKKKD